MVFGDGKMLLIEDVEKQANFYRKEQKVHEYAMEFWEEIVPYIDIAQLYIKDKILPLYCFWSMEEIVEAVESGSKTARTGSLVYYKERQAVIRIGIDCDDDCLTEKLKKTIRHELTHYLLWLGEMGHEDNDLDFWCYCHVFKARAYSKLTDENKVKYELFKKVYDKKIKKMPVIVASNIILEILEKFKENDVVTEEEIKQLIDEQVENFARAGIKI